MAIEEETAYIEDQDEVDALAEFAPRIREILRQYRSQRQLSAIAKKLGFHQSRLTEMITKNAKGEYKTRITPYYLARFIDSGVMDVSQILQSRRLDSVSERAQIFFERMVLSRSTLKLVIEAQHRGIDVDRILQEILYPKHAK